MPVVLILKEAMVANVCLDSLGMVSHAQVINTKRFHGFSIILTYFFPDIDECTDSNLNNCSLNANCSDNIGSYDCTCSAGYVGDGYFCDGKSVNKLGRISFCIMLFHHSIQANVY